MAYPEREKQDTIRRFRLGRWLVLGNTLYWIVYIIVAQLGYEDRLPLGKEIIRIENREKVVFFDPVIPDSVAASTRIIDPRGKSRYPIGEDPLTFAFSINLDGPWGLGVWPGFAMKVNPRVELLDDQGTLLADNSQSSYSWTPYSGIPGKGRDTGDDERRRYNTHGAGLTANLSAGKTYLLRIGPEKNQDLYHTEYSNNEMGRKANTYDLVIQPYRSGSDYTIIAISMLIGVPVIYLFLLLRFSARLTREEGPSPARQQVDAYFVNSKKRVENQREEKNGKE